ncbi:hypothetical protein Tco_0141422 [Tanacetum coccineum]
MSSSSSSSSSSLTSSLSSSLSPQDSASLSIESSLDTSGTLGFSQVPSFVSLGLSVCSSGTSDLKSALSLEALA